MEKFETILTLFLTQISSLEKTEEVLKAFPGRLFS